MKKILSGAAALGATLALSFSSAGAQAQSPCASPYVLQPGETIYQIAQQCRVPLAELRAANPDIENIRDLPVGTRVTIPGAGGSTGNDTAPAATHELAAGETLYSVAERYQTSVETLLDANPGIEPDDLAVGLTLRLPLDVADVPPEEPVDGEPAISVQPKAGGPGAPVTVRGSNLEPQSSVEIGVGPPQSEWEMLTRQTVRDSGAVTAHVRIPEQAEPGRQLVFVIHTRAGETLVSDEVQVVEASDPDQPGDGTDMRTEQGRLREGVECLVLETPEGRVFSVTGIAPRFAAGDYVEVTGRVADVSFCMQGETTIAVESARRVPPPGLGGGQTLTRSYAIAPWAAEGSRCSTPDFEIASNAAGGQVVETSLDGAPRTGYARLGESPAFVFDQPRRELPIEAHPPDGLAVMPPASGPVSLGGVRIEGDGTVFVRCP